MKHPLVLIHFGKRFKDKLWLGLGLGRCGKTLDELNECLLAGGSGKQEK